MPYKSDWTDLWSLRIEVYALEEWKREREYEEIAQSCNAEWSCADEPIDVWCAERPPVLVAGTMTQLEVPDEVRRKCISGEVHVEYVVRRDGTVGDIRIVEAPDPDAGLVEAVVESVRGWLYTPAQCNGAPAAVFGTSYRYSRGSWCDEIASIPEVRPGCQQAAEPTTGSR